MASLLFSEFFSQLPLVAFLRMSLSQGYNPHPVRYAFLVIVPVFIHPYIPIDIINLKWCNEREPGLQGGE
jgi:hypothetical protein